MVAYPVGAVAPVSGHVALGTEIVSVPFPGRRVISIEPRPHLDHLLHSWDLVPLVCGVRRDFEGGVREGSYASSRMTKVG